MHDCIWHWSDDHRLVQNTNPCVEPKSTWWGDYVTKWRSHLHSVCSDLGPTCYDKYAILLSATQERWMRKPWFHSHILERLHREHSVSEWIEIQVVPQQWIFCCDMSRHICKTVSWWLYHVLDLIILQFLCFFLILRLTTGQSFKDITRV